MKTILFFLKKHKVLIIACIIVSICYFSSRLFNLLSLPIFTDEAIYVRWAQIAKNDASWRFISLTDGKQPMFVWLTMVAMRFFQDPLYAGRVVSVFAGFGTMIGLFFVGKELYKNKWVGLIAAALYLFYPFSLVYDRMALYDSLVGTFTVWGLYMTILLVKYNRLDIALIFGFVAGAGVLNKTNNFFTIYLLPTSLLLFDWKSNNRNIRLLKWVMLAIVVTILTYLYYAILRLSPFYHIINEKNATFVYPFNEWLQHPFTFFTGNLKGLFDWFVTYMSFPVLSAAMIGGLVFRKTYRKENILLFTWFIIPFLAFALFARVMYPRYIFPMTLSLLPLFAWYLYESYRIIKMKFIFVGVIVALFIVSWIRADIRILTDFAGAPIPESDMYQYSKDWPAGGGIREAITFFKNESKDREIFLGTQGTFGLLPAAFEIYLGQNKNIHIKGFWPIENVPPRDLTEAAKKMPTYIVFYQPCSVCKGLELTPAQWPVEPVMRYKKSDSAPYVTIYKFLPK